MRLTGHRACGVAMALVGALAAGAPASARDSGAGAYLAARQADQRGDVEASARYFARALQDDPDDRALLEAGASALVAAGRVDEAEAAAERLAALDPSHRIVALIRAAQAFKRADFAAARALLADQPDAFHPLMLKLMQGWAAQGAGDAAAARAAFETVGDRPVLRLFGQYHLGLMLMQNGDAEGALAAFEAAQAEVTAPTTRLSTAHGGALEALGRGPEALAVYEAALAASRFGDPAMEAAIARLAAGGAAPLLVASAAEGAAEALFGLAGALVGESGGRVALIHARLATHLRPSLTAAQLLVAELMDADGQPELALAAYAAVPGDDPLWTRAQIRRAAALEQLERGDAAVEALRALTARETHAAEAHIALADLLRRREAYVESAEAYGRAIEIVEAAGRADWTLFYQRGVAHERAGAWDAAEADFKRALTLSPDQPLVLNYLGYSWVEMGRNLDEAMAMIRTAVDMRPDDGYITDSLGWVHYRLGNFAEAVEWLEKAVALAPVDPVINDHLGDALWRVGRRLEAQFQWKRARSFDPEPKDLARIKRKLALGLDAVLEEEAAAAPAPHEAMGRDGG